MEFKLIEDSIVRTFTIKLDVAIDHSEDEWKAMIKEYVDEITDSDCITTWDYVGIERINVDTFYVVYYGQEFTLNG